MRAAGARDAISQGNPVTNPHPLVYVTPFDGRLPHSELGSLALAFTGIWLFCVTITSATAAIEGWILREPNVMFALAGLTLTAMVILIPMGFLVALLAMTERDCRRASA